MCSIYNSTNPWESFKMNKEMLIQYMNETIFYDVIDLLVKRRI